MATKNITIAASKSRLRIASRSRRIARLAIVICPANVQPTASAAPLLHRARPLSANKAPPPLYRTGGYRLSPGVAVGGQAIDQCVSRSFLGIGSLGSEVEDTAVRASRSSPPRRAGGGAVGGWVALASSLAVTAGWSTASPAWTARTAWITSRPQALLR